MRKFLLILCYVGASVGCYALASTVVEPVAFNRLLFDSINRQDVRAYSENERLEIAAKVNLVWGRIETKLKEIAPGSLKVLNVPASDFEISAFEEKLGMVLPPDLEASLRRHNGSRAGFGVFNFNSTHGIIHDHANLSHEEVADWPAAYWEDAFSHEGGNWEPGALNVGWNYFGMIVDTEQRDITLILSSRNYSGPHHDSFLASLNYIADLLESGDCEIRNSDNGEPVFVLGGWGCEHY